MRHVTADGEPHLCHDSPPHVTNDPRARTKRQSEQARSSENNEVFDQKYKTSKLIFVPFLHLIFYNCLSWSFLKNLTMRIDCIISPNKLSLSLLLRRQPIELHLQRRCSATNSEHDTDVVFTVLYRAGVVNDALPAAEGGVREARGGFAER